MTSMIVSGQYDVIVVDPPWAYGSADDAKPGAAAAQYHTIGNEGREINRKTGAGVENIVAAAPIALWAKADAQLYLWTTNPKLPFAFHVMEAWGFEYKTTLTWVKTTKSGEPIRNGMGFFFRGSTEHVLLGVRGRFPIPSELREPNEFELPDPGWAFGAQRGAHSEKPQQFYDMIARITPNARRLDVFARKQRPGWDVWGDEV